MGRPPEALSQRQAELGHEQVRQAGGQGNRVSGESLEQVLDEPQGLGRIVRIRLQVSDASVVGVASQIIGATRGGSKKSFMARSLLFEYLVKKSMHNFLENASATLRTAVSVERFSSAGSSGWRSRTSFGTTMRQYQTPCRLLKRWGAWRFMSTHVLDH